MVKFIRLILKQNSFRMIHAGKSILICFLTFFSISVFAQNWSDNFNDGDYTSGSKIWSGIFSNYFLQLFWSNFKGANVFGLWISDENGNWTNNNVANVTKVFNRKDCIQF